MSICRCERIKVIYFPLELYICQHLHMTGKILGQISFYNSKKTAFPLLAPKAYKNKFARIVFFVY